MLSSYLLLQQAQIHHLELIHIDQTQSEFAKALIALRYSRQMAWDMVRESIEKVRSKEDVRKLPFARLSFIIRATIGVFETKRYGEAIECSDAELRGFTIILEWFAAKWSLGGKLQLDL
jgi:hypothetical protein